MLQFNKKENNQEIDLIKVVSLLIHAAKIDEKYTDEERKLIKEFILNFSQLNKKNVAEKDVKEILITNRTEAKGKRFAETYDLETLPFKKMLSEINKVDVIVFSTSSDKPLITKEDINKSYDTKKNKNTLFIDLSVPRNIDENISSIESIELINIDNLKDIVNKNYNKRKAEIDKSQKIIDSFLLEFDEWANSRQLRPSILSIKKKIKILIENNMNIKPSIEKTNDENINIKINRVYNKLSDHLVKKIRVASNNGRDKKALEVIKKIFNEE